MTRPEDLKAAREWLAGQGYIPSIAEETRSLAALLAKTRRDAMEKCAKIAEGAADGWRETAVSTLDTRENHYNAHDVVLQSGNVAKSIAAAIREEAERD